jgi:hypothetical protein
MRRQYFLTFLLLTLILLALLSSLFFELRLIISSILLLLIFAIFWTANFVETNRKEGGKIFVLISGIIAIVICLVIISYPYVSGSWIPVGWDTGRHLYWAKLAYNLDFQRFFTETNANSFLAPLIIAALARYMSQDIFSMRIVTTYLYCIALIILTGWIALRSFRNHIASGLSMLFVVAMIPLYRLSADLHKTLLATICLLIFILVYTSENIGKERLPFIILFSACTAFSQIEYGILLIGICLIFEVLNYVLNREINGMGLFFSLIGLLIPILFAFIFSTTFIQVLVSYPVTLNPPSLSFIVTFMGGIILILFPVSIIIIIFNHFDLVNNKTLLFIMVFCLAIIILVIIPAFFIESPTIFRKTAPRAIMILPLSVIYGIGSSFLQSTRLRSSGGLRTANKILTSLFLLSIIILGISFTAVEAQIHHQPFVTQDLYNQLTWLEDNVQFEEIPIFITQGLSVNSYKNTGWIGSFMGYHHSYNGPLIFLMLGYSYPSTDTFTNLYNKKLINEIKTYYGNASDQIQQAPIVILTSVYGNLDYELNLSRQLESGIYIVDVNNPNFTIDQYYIRVNEHFSTEGRWYYSYAGDTRYVVGILSDTTISRSYPAVFHKTGNVSFSFDYTISVNSTLRLYLNETLLSEIELTRSTQRTLITTQIIALEGINFIRFEIESNNEGTISLSKIQIKTL